MDNSDLHWVKRTKRVIRSKCKADVYIRIHNLQKTLKGIAFNFNKDCKKIVCGESRYLMFAIFKNRIYFAPSEEGVGYAFDGERQNRSRLVSKKAILNTKELDLYSKFIGDYELKYDEARGLWYIEKQNIEEG